MKQASGIYEVELRDVYNYRYSYGGQSAFFQGLAEGKLVGSKCGGCGHVWVPVRTTCSRCYTDTQLVELSGEGEIVCALPLSSPPPRLKHIKSPIASALVKPDGADDCIKVMVVSKTGTFARGTRVKAKYLRAVKTVADFYFVTG